MRARAGALGLGLASVLHGPPPRVPRPGPVRDKAPEGLPARGQFRASGWYTGLNLASDSGKNVFFFVIILMTHCLKVRKFSRRMWISPSSLESERLATR